MLQGHQVTVEITSGQTYRGKLIEGALEEEWQCDAERRRRLMLRTAEDNMNVQMENINVTQRDGRVTHLDRVYIRGSHVRLFIVPDMLRYVYMGLILEC
jgi:small nuclear ribonucleoprotein D3